MMMNGMFFMFFWMFFGALVFIALLAAVIWLVLRAVRSQSPPVMPPWQSPVPPPYAQEPPASQLYVPPSSPETEMASQGERIYPPSEHPSPSYPHDQEHREEYPS